MTFQFPLFDESQTDFIQQNLDEIRRRDAERAKARKLKCIREARRMASGLKPSQQWEIVGSVD